MSKRRGSFFETNLQPHRKALKVALFKEFQEIPLIQIVPDDVFQDLSRVIRRGDPDSSKANTVIEKFQPQHRAELRAILDSFSRRYHALDPRMESANLPAPPHNATYNAGLGRALNRYTRRVGRPNHGQEHLRPFRKSSSETRRPRLTFLGKRRSSSNSLTLSSSQKSTNSSK
jgi:hypothetical protein